MSERSNVIRVDFQARARCDAGAKEAAYGLYRQACALDEDARTLDEAKALYERAIALDPTLAVARTNLGNIHYKQGDYATAGRLYHEAIALDATEPVAHFNLGHVYLDRRQPALAREQFDAAIRIVPTLADAFFCRALAHDALLDIRAARSDYASYLALAPNGAFANDARARLAAPFGTRAKRLSDGSPRPPTTPKKGP